MCSRGEYSGGIDCPRSKNCKCKCFYCGKIGPNCQGFESSWCPEYLTDGSEAETDEYESDNDAELFIRVLGNIAYDDEFQYLRLRIMNQLLSKTEKIH